MVAQVFRVSRGDVGADKMIQMHVYMDEELAEAATTEDFSVVQLVRNAGSFALILGYRSRPDDLCGSLNRLVNSIGAGGERGSAFPWVASNPKGNAPPRGDRRFRFDR